MQCCYYLQSVIKCNIKMLPIVLEPNQLNSADQDRHDIERSLSLAVFLSGL